VNDQLDSHFDIVALNSLRDKNPCAINTYFEAYRPEYGAVDVIADQYVIVHNRKIVGWIDGDIAKMYTNTVTGSTWQSVTGASGGAPNPVLAAEALIAHQKDRCDRAFAGRKRWRGRGA
jgi:hypothetical protein